MKVIKKPKEIKKFKELRMKNTPQKRVLIFGTFDILHPGHLHIINKAASLGNLYIVVARDETVKTIKGIVPVNSELQRKKNLESLNIAEQVVLGKKRNKFIIIEEINPNIICIGYDQRSFVDALPEELKKRNLDCEIIKIDSFEPEKYKSSKMKFYANKK